MTLPLRSEWSPCCIHVQHASCYSRYQNSSAWVPYPCFPSSISLTEAYTSQSTNMNRSHPSPYLFPMLAMTPSSLGSRSDPWLGECLNMPPPSYPILRSPLPDRVVPVFVKIVSPPLGCSPSSYFLVVCLHVVTRDVHWSYLRLLMCPSQDHFIFFSHWWLYLCLLSSLSDPDVGLSVLVCNVEHTSFHVGPCDRKFVLRLFCEYSWVGHNLWRAYLQVGHYWAWAWPIWKFVFTRSPNVSHSCAWSQRLSYRLSSNEALHWL